MIGKRDWESFKTNWNQLKTVNTSIMASTNKFTSSIYTSNITPKNDNLNHINNLIKLNNLFLNDNNDNDNEKIKKLMIFLMDMMV